MFKNLKMRALITSCIAVIAIICMSFLYVVQSKDTTSVMKKIATNNMSTALDAQANMIRQYVDNSERLLKEYGSAIEIKNVLEKQNDASAQKIAQGYTERFFANLDSWEGLYTGNWNTTVLTHSSSPAIGMTLRTGDDLAPFLNAMTDSPDGLLNSGVLQSPSSGKMLLNLRMAIFGDNGKPIGFVGGGPFINGLKDILYDFTVSGLEGATYSVLEAV